MLAGRKTLLLVTAVLYSWSIYAQDTYIRVQGQIKSTEDGTGLKAPILYEKLPYYDDMGMVSSASDGTFEFFLIQGLDYNISIKKDGFEEYTSKISIKDEGQQAMSLNFEITPRVVPEDELFVLENLIFNSGSEVIQKSSFGGLDEFAKWLKDRPSYVVQLEGHTDISGNAGANMRLSQARVDAVKEYITKKGIKKSRVFTKAFGGTNPLSEERTDAARRGNRRVEVRVIGR